MSDGGIKGKKGKKLERRKEKQGQRNESQGWRRMGNCRGGEKKSHRGQKLNF